MNILQQSIRKYIINIAYIKYTQSNSFEEGENRIEERTESNSFVALAIEFNKRWANMLQHAALPPR